MNSKPSKTPRAFIYSRVSALYTIDFDDINLEAQITSCQKWCNDNKLNVIEVFSDCYSSMGNSLVKPGLEDMVNQLKKGDTVIVYTFTIFSKHQLDILNCIQAIEKKKSRVVSLLALDFSSNTPAIRANREFIINMEQLELRLIRENIKVEISKRKNENQYVGITSYEESKLIKLIIKYIDTMKYSTQEIANHLNENQIPVISYDDKYYQTTLDEVDLSRQPKTFSPEVKQSGAIVRIPDWDAKEYIEEKMIERAMTAEVRQAKIEQCLRELKRR